MSDHRLLRMSLSAVPAGCWRSLDDIARPRRLGRRPKDETPHVVQAGDTLEGLSQSYFGTPRLGTSCKRATKSKTRASCSRARWCGFPWACCPLNPPRWNSFTVMSVHTTAEPEPPQNPAAANLPVVAGTMLAEGTRLPWGPNGFVTVRLADGSIVKVSAQSDVQLRQLRRRGRAGSVQSVVEIQRGSVESSVAPSTDASRRFEVRNPAHRDQRCAGTRFGVALSESGDTTAAVPARGCGGAITRQQPRPAHRCGNGPGNPAGTGGAKPMAPWAAREACCPRPT